MAKILGVRTWETPIRGVGHITEFRRKRLTSLYGRSDLPISLQNAVVDHARERKISLKEALMQMVEAVGGYDNLAKTYRKMTKNAQKNYRKKINKGVSSKKSTLAETVYKKVYFMPGGAPGLGGNRKPLCIK